jgi:hypothetical protein
MKMFGGVAATVNGNLFAGLFGRSTMIWLPEIDRAEALALDGAAPFDPMGNGRVRSDKVMLPEAFMKNPGELRRWIARAFTAAAELPAKASKASPAGKGGQSATRSAAATNKANKGNGTKGAKRAVARAAAGAPAKPRRA